MTAAAGDGGTATAESSGAEARAASEAGARTGQRMPPTAALQETLLLLNRVVHAAVTSIVVSDPHQPDCPIVYHNPAFERVSGYPAGEIDGRNCRFLQGPDTDRETVHALRDCLRAGEPFHGTLLNYKKDGTPFWNELAISPVHDANGGLTHFVGVQHDVTQRVEAEAERDALLAQQRRIVETLQRALLLTAPPAFEGLEVVTHYEPASDEAQFGGDFYDAFPLDERRAALVCGDVTGKGLKAAQYTAEVKYGLRILLRHHPDDPTPALGRLNQFLMDAQQLDDRDETALVAIALAVVDTRTGEGQVTAAGMEPPLLVRADGSAEEVEEAGGPLLGVDREAPYTAVPIRLGAGDALVLATDGITEARPPGAARSFFGFEGLTRAAREALLAPGAAASTPDLGAAGGRIADAARAHAGGRLQDDVCVLLARRAAAAGSTGGSGE